MNIVLHATPIVLYMFVGIVSLMMARKSLFSNQFLPFHREASGKSWDEVDKGLQSVVISLLRVSGLGFLVVAIILMIFPLVSLFSHNPLVEYAIPVISLMYCVGLFVISYQLHIKTGAATPWKRSLYAAALILVGIVVSFAQ